VDFQAVSSDNAKQSLVVDASVGSVQFRSMQVAPVSATVPPYNLWVRAPNTVIQIVAPRQLRFREHTTLEFFSVEPVVQYKNVPNAGETASIGLYTPTHATDCQLKIIYTHWARRRGDIRHVNVQDMVGDPHDSVGCVQGGDACFFGTNANPGFGYPQYDVGCCTATAGFSALCPDTQAGAFIPTSTTIPAVPDVEAIDLSINPFPPNHIQNIPAGATWPAPAPSNPNTAPGNGNILGLPNANQYQVGPFTQYATSRYTAIPLGDFSDPSSNPGSVFPPGLATTTPNYPSIAVYPFTTGGGAGLCDVKNGEIFLLNDVIFHGGCPNVSQRAEQIRQALNCYGLFANS